MPALEDFVAHRDLLFTVAYELLGSAADAEDVLQEVWLRWSDVDREVTEVRDPRAYLVRITTRLGLNRLRSLARRREDYVGPWLPEPLLTSPDVAEDVELAESVATAMMLVLETLGPVERAVFVLREVFDVPYAEIAASVDRTPEAVRQIARRARMHVGERRPRSAVATRDQREVVEHFRRASRTGDLQQLMDVLAPEVVLLTDGGGQVQAALHPIRGVEKVLRFLAGVRQPGTELRALTVSGQPGFAVLVEGRLDAIGTVQVDGGLVRTIYVVRNPDKLASAHQEVTLSRG